MQFYFLFLTAPEIAAQQIWHMGGGQSVVSSWLKLLFDQSMCLKISIEALRYERFMKASLQMISTLWLFLLGFIFELDRYLFNNNY